MWIKTILFCVTKCLGTPVVMGYTLPSSVTGVYVQLPSNSARGLSMSTRNSAWLRRDSYLSEPLNLRRASFPRTGPSRKPTVSAALLLSVIARRRISTTRADMSVTAASVGQFRDTSENSKSTKTDHLLQNDRTFSADIFSLFTRTKRYCSLVQYGLSHYQNRIANS